MPKPLQPLRMVVLISGGGTTLRNLIEQIADGQLDARIERVISSNPQAGGLSHASAAGIPTEVIERRDYQSDAEYGAAVFAACRRTEPGGGEPGKAGPSGSESGTAGPDLVVMAGFLKFAPVPDDFIGRVVNIHPSLIPAFCGHGMYGEKVHRAVLDYGAKLSGCTVHFVDNQYDHGPIILQRSVAVHDDDTPESLAARVFEVECELYPEALRLFAAGRLKLDGRRVEILPP